MLTKLPTTDPVNKTMSAHEDHVLDVGSVCQTGMDTQSACLLERHDQCICQHAIVSNNCGPGNARWERLRRR